MPAASNLERLGGVIDVVGSTLDMVHLLNGQAGISNPHGSTSCLPGFSPHVLCMGALTADKTPG